MCCQICRRLSPNFIPCCFKYSLFVQQLLNPNLLVPFSDAEREWKGPFCFILATDPQLGLMKAWKDGDTESGGDVWEEEVELTKRAVEAVNQLRPRPKFMVLCGDMVHALPGTNTTHEGIALRLKSIRKNVQDSEDCRGNATRHPNH